MLESAGRWVGHRGRGELPAELPEVWMLTGKWGRSKAMPRHCWVPRALQELPGTGHRPFSKDYLYIPPSLWHPSKRDPLTAQPPARAVGWAGETGSKRVDSGRQ